MEIKPLTPEEEAREAFASMGRHDMLRGETPVFDGLSSAGACDKSGRWDLLTPNSQKVDDGNSVQDKQVGGNHYKDYAFQPWDIIDEYGLDFYEGCVLKYLLRHKDNRKQDLEKAIHCIEKIIEDINNEH